MSSKRGRSRTSGAISDKRETDPKDSPESEKPKSEKPESPLSFEYETEDGLKISIDPTSAEISREYEITEEDSIEFVAGIEWTSADFNVEKKGLDLSVSGEIGVPGDILGISGGVTIDLGSGEIEGGEVGGAIGGVEVSVSVEGEKGCKKSVQITFAGVGIAYTRDDCNEDEDTKPPPGEGSEDEARGREGKSPNGNQIRRMVPNSGCGVVRYLACIGTITTWSIDEFGFQIRGSRKHQVVGAPQGGRLVIPPGGSVYGAYMEYNGRFVYANHIGTTNTYYGPDFLVKQFGGALSNHYSVFADGSVTKSIGGGLDASPDSTVYPSPGSIDDEDRSLAQFYFGLAQVFYITDSDSGCSIKDIRSSRNRPRIPPSPPPRKVNPMDKCCADTTKMLRDIYKVLDVKEMLNKGVETPNRWIAAGGKKYTKNQTYLELMIFQMRMMDHLGIHPFTAQVTDVNAAQEGNQSAAIEFANATAAVKQIAELLLENKGDASTRLNLMIRTAVAVGQVLNVVSIIAKTLEGVVQYLGMPIRERVYKVKMPFDFTFGARKKDKSGQGFGKKPGAGSDALNINTEEATEALLPVFMQDSEQPITVEDFDDRESDLTDIIRGK